jgi:uncharacterized membrane protein YgaE (UPF0421/DUF939 family)
MKPTVTSRSAVFSEMLSRFRTIGRFEQDGEPRFISDNRGSTALHYGIETITTTALLLWIFGATGWPGVGWSIITAILVLQPGLNQSMAASTVRICATLLGAIAGTATGLFLDAPSLALLAGISITIVVCHYWHLDRHLRQACLTVPIIQMSQDGTVVLVSYKRVIAVLVGCAVPVLVQWGWNMFSIPFRRKVDVAK